jgi:hypothetical protein
MSIQSLVTRIARGGSNTRRRSRRSNRPRGEGRGFVDSVKRLFGKR